MTDQEKRIITKVSDVLKEEGLDHAKVLVAGIGLPLNEKNEGPIFYYSDGNLKAVMSMATAIYRTALGKVRGN